MRFALREGEALQHDRGGILPEGRNSGSAVIDHLIQQNSGKSDTNPALRWTDRLASHNGDWSGNIYDFYTRVYMKIAVDLKKPFRLDGIYRIDDTPVHVAVREAMANCLSNADYFLPECVKIEKYPDRLVLTNPGTILLGKKQMLRGGKSRPRNKVILNMLNFIGIGERAGSGVPNIYAIWEKEGYVEPTVEEMSGREGTITTVVTLPLVKNELNVTDRNQVVYQVVFENQPDKQPNKQPDTQPKPRKADKIGERAEAVIAYLRKFPSSSRGDLASALDISETQARTALELLKKQGRISHEGSSYGGKWIVTD